MKENAHRELMGVNENKSNMIMESKGKGKYDRKSAYIR